MRKMAHPARSTATGLEVPTRLVIVAGITKMLAPVTPLTMAAVRLHRPIARINVDDAWREDSTFGARSSTRSMVGWSGYVKVRSVHASGKGWRGHAEGHHQEHEGGRWPHRRNPQDQ